MRALTFAQVLSRLALFRRGRTVRHAPRSARAVLYRDVSTRGGPIQFQEWHRTNGWGRRMIGAATHRFNQPVVSYGYKYRVH